MKVKPKPKPSVWRTPPVLHKRGFTLVELLVVIAIIGMLVAILLPAVQNARSAARRTQCQNKLKQLGIALIAHEAALGTFPPGVTADSHDLQNGKYSGLVNLLPYLELQNIYDEFNREVDWKSARNPAIAAMVIDAYQCPSSPSSVGMGSQGAATDYAFSKGPLAFLCKDAIQSHHGMFDVNSAITRAHVKDGLSKTFAMGEAASSASLEAVST